MFSSSRVLYLSLWFPYTLPECLPVVPLSNTCHMTTFVLVDVMEKLHMDKAGRKFQFSCSVVSDSLWPRGLQHARLPCPSPTLLSPHLHHQHELIQTHVHWVGDAIQPSHPLTSPLPLAFNRSQYQGLFQWVSSSPQVAKVLGLQLQHQSFQWIFRVDFL